MVEKEGIYYIVSYNLLQGKYTLPTTYKIIEWSDYMEKENKLNNKIIWEHIGEHIGTKIKRPFLIKGYEHEFTYRITNENGFEIKNDYSSLWRASDDGELLLELLKGQKKIVEIVEEFKVGDKFKLPQFETKFKNEDGSLKTIIYDDYISQLISCENGEYKLKANDNVLISCDRHFLSLLKRI